VQGPVAELLDRCRVLEPAALLRVPAGRVWCTQLTYLDISATDIRERIASGRSARFLLPDAVWVYIQQERLYGVPAVP